MKEILPGIFHWKTFHEGIGALVHSYYISITTPAILIDPRVPEQGLAWFARHTRPEHVYLTNRHHYRHSDQFEQAFDCKVWCHKDGLHEFKRGQRVRPFNHGDALPGGVVALKVGELCPEETALYLPVSGGVLSIGDAIMRYDGELGFVSDELIGDDPEAVKKGLKRAFLNHLQRDFDHMLFAHGPPWVGGAKDGLRQFLQTV